MTEPVGAETGGAPPTPERCRNCGTTLAGPYCHDCGQRSESRLVPVRALARAAVEELLTLDVRLLHTLRRLLRPGALTDDYLQGRRAPYTPPFRLFVFAGFVFLLAIGLGQRLRPDESGLVIDLSRETVTELEARRDALRRRGTAWAEVRSFWLGSILDAHRQPDQLNRLFAERASVMAVLLIPAFALTLRLLYRGRLYMEHLIFTLHLHAVVFGVVGIALLLGMGGYLLGLPGAPLTAGFALAGCSVLAYTWVALRRVYESGPVRTTLKLCALAGAYVAAFTAVLTAYAFATIVTL